MNTSLTVEKGLSPLNGSQQGATESYRPDIDGIRAIAVLLVMGFHSFPVLVRGGFIGVDVFFVISGYLITGTILKARNADRFTFLQFYARRFRRIAPALAVVLAGTVLLGTYLLLPAEFDALGQQVWAGSAFVTNILLWRQAGYFDAAAATKPLLHLWSLGVEEQFYLLWPPLLLLVTRRGLNNARTFAWLAVSSFALNVALITYDPTATFYLLPTRFWELLVGAILVQMELDCAGRSSGRLGWLFGPEVSPILQNTKAWLGLVGVAAAAMLLHDSSPFPGWWAVLPTGATFLLISAGHGAWLNRTILSNRAAVTLGLISYPLYLWHWPLLSFAQIAESSIPSRSIRLGCLVLAMILAWLTWRLVELPVRRRFVFGSRRNMRACVALSLSTLALLAALGVATEAQRGFPGRFARRVPAGEGQLRDATAQLDDLAAVPYPQRSFPRCSGELAAGATLDWCNTAAAGMAQVALFGDSHAIYLFPGFAKVFSARGQNSLVIGQSACAPVLGIRSFLRGTNEQCSAANQLAVDILARSPAVSTVVLSALGPYYFSGTSFDSEHRGASDASNWVLEPIAGMPGGSKEQLFESGYSATIGRLEAAGKQVVFFIDVPELDFHPAVCIPRPVRISRRGVKSPCAVPLSVVVERQTAYRALVERLTQRHPRLLVFDTLSYLCDQGMCSAMHDGRPVYRDSNHLTAYGGEYLSEKLAGWLASR